GLVVIPDISIAAPILVAVLLGAGELLEMKQARLQAFTARWVAAFHLHAECLDQHRAVGELPARRRAGRRLGIGDLVETDLAVAGNGDEPFFVGVIAPKLSIDGIRNDSWRDLVVLGRREDAGLAELARELRRLIFLVVLDELVDTAAGEIEEIQF